MTYAATDDWLKGRKIKSLGEEKEFGIHLTSRPDKTVLKVIGYT